MTFPKLAYAQTIGNVTHDCEKPNVDILRQPGYQRKTFCYAFTTRRRIASLTERALIEGDSVKVIELIKAEHGSSKNI